MQKKERTQGKGENILELLKETKGKENTEERINFNGDKGCKRNCKQSGKLGQGPQGCWVTLPAEPFGQCTAVARGAYLAVTPTTGFVVVSLTAYLRPKMAASAPVQKYGLRTGVERRPKDEFTEESGETGQFLCCGECRTSNRQTSGRQQGYTLPDRVAYLKGGRRGRGEQTACISFFLLVSLQNIRQ